MLIFLGFTFYTKQQEEAYLKAHPKTAQTAKYPVGDSAAATATTDSAKSTQVATAKTDSAAPVRCV